MRSASRRFVVGSIAHFFAVAILLAPPAWAAESSPEAKALAAKILAETKVQGGFVVHLGCSDGDLTAALRPNDRYQVQGLARDAKQVAKARKHIQSLGVYGDVAVDRLSGKTLPYVDNLVNLVVAEKLGNVSMDEVLRVLVPDGVAYVKGASGWKKTVKPRPKNIDEWTHFLHSAGGNAVAHDSVVGPPRHLQWIGSPRWSRHHDRMASMSALVTTGGRIFYVMDEGSRVSIQLPPKWMLVARDAFNGTVLWKREIPAWHSHLWPLKSGPTQLARRLVAIGDRVYMTLGIDAPVSALDAATGETVMTFKGSEKTEELIVSDGLLLALAHPGRSPLRDYKPQHNVGDQRRVAQQFRWDKVPRKILAFDTSDAKLRWQHESRVAPLNLAADGERVYFYDGAELVSLDRKSGSKLWQNKAGSRSNVTFNFGPKLVIYDDIVLFAGGDRKMLALAAKTGKELWSAPHDRSGYQSPEDLLVSSGIVWSAPTTATKDSGVYTGRDVKTGEVKHKFAPKVNTYWFHHRCYIAKATDRFLLPSRTGIEFVDWEAKKWMIHHWVRGGCLYGIMPANGLTYAPPHNCACYPEAKLFGFNALAPASASRSVPKKMADANRLEKGPAFDDNAENKFAPTDWPTYRNNAARSGSTKANVSHKLQPKWEAEIGGRLSSVTVAGGRLFVADIDAHQVYALDADTGKIAWKFTAGGRVDSPPTIFAGRALFGSADGWVYCLRVSDGELAWRFRAAPNEQRLMSLEQLESIWPVHGSVLVQNGEAHFVAGRSSFLDGGLRLIRLDAKTGRKISENVLDDLDPETRKNLQTHVKILNMPVGLPDVLSTDGERIYMRSQVLDFDGKRSGIAPHSGDPRGQGSVQRGETAHLFSPTGFLDGTYFHRSYWVYGRSFAGGHSGYHQAGKFAPAGRMMVFDDENAYGFGRKSQYYKWTTTIEHQLFSASKKAPAAPSEAEKKLARRGGTSMIRFEKSKSLDPTGKPVAVEAWINADKPRGVVLARGGPARGYALFLNAGRPTFGARLEGKLYTAEAKEKIGTGWVHLVGTLNDDKKIRLYVDGKLVATSAVPHLIKEDPVQALEIGADDVTAVGEYNSPFGFSGTIDEVNVYHANVTAKDVAARFASPDKALPESAGLVLSCSFDKGGTKDFSGKGNDGKRVGATASKGKIAGGMRFVGGKSGGGKKGGSIVKHNWARDMPLFARAMVLADKTIFVAGPPDLVDEEKTFALLTQGDKAVQKKLAAQDEALAGKQGGMLIAVSATTGEPLATIKLKSLPNWDAMAATPGRVFLSTSDGKVVCFADQK